MRKDRNNIESAIFKLSGAAMIAGTMHLAMGNTVGAHVDYNTQSFDLGQTNFRCHESIANRQASLEIEGGCGLTRFRITFDTQSQTFIQDSLVEGKTMPKIAVKVKLP
jgi:hypothetical protein